MTESQRKTLGIIAILSVATSVLFLFLFLITSYGMNIQRVTLSKTLFDNLDNPELKYDYTFDNLSNNIVYNIKVRLAKRPDIDYMEIVEHRRNFSIKVLLRDSAGGIIANDNIDKDSNIPSAWGRNYIDFTVARFKAKSQKNYLLTIAFENSHHFFDLFQKNANELFVEEDYDYAAVPWNKALHLLSTLILVTSFLSATITISILVLNKKQAVQ